MISYTQRHAVSEALASTVHAAFGQGKTAWLDAEMGRRDEAAMKEAVENSRCVIKNGRHCPILNKLHCIRLPTQLRTSLLQSAGGCISSRTWDSQRRALGRAW